MIPSKAFFDVLFHVEKVGKHHYAIAVKKSCWECFLKQGENWRKFEGKNFLPGGGNLRRSDFDHLNSDQGAGFLKREIKSTWCCNNQLTSTSKIFVLGVGSI